MKNAKLAIFCILASIFSTILLIAGYHAGTKIPFSQQWPLFEALRTTAAIIFAVVGAWLAIIYPERLKFSFREKNENNSIGKIRIGKVLSPAVHSTAILCVVLLFGIIAPILKVNFELVDYKNQLRGASYCLLVLLTLWQLATIILTLIPIDAIKSYSDNETEKLEIHDRVFKNTKIEK